MANSTATIFSLDVYARIINKQADDRLLVRVGRFASFEALLIAAVCAPVVGQWGGIFTYFQTGATYLSTPISSVIAKLAIYLCSDDADFIVGQTIAADGGSSVLTSLKPDFRTPTAARWGAGYIPNI